MSKALKNYNYCYSIILGGGHVKIYTSLKWWITVTLVCLILLTQSPVSLADSSSVVVIGNQTWERVQAYAKAMQEQELWNRQYLVPTLGGLLLLAIILGIGWRLTHKKPPKPKNKYSWWD